MVSGLTAALAGILLAGYSGQAYLGMGDAYLFTSIAAVAIGGALLVVYGAVILLTISVGSESFANLLGLLVKRKKEGKP